ncbi:hypothetical protein SVIOM342S_07840 [Streptomyces violaceorubidus]
MSGAWVGPLYWIQWAGGRRRLHPRGRRSGPGGEFRPPDRAPAALGRWCAEFVRSVFECGCVTLIWLKITSGDFGVLPPSPWELRARGGAKGRVPGAHSRRLHSLPGGVPGAVQGSWRLRVRFRESARRGHTRLRRRSVARPSWQHGKPVGAVHWLSPACGGVDAVVGGVEQRRRGSSGDRRSGRLRRCHRLRRRDRAARGRPAAVGRPRPPVGGRRLAPRRGARRQRRRTDPDRRPRHLRCERRAVARRAVRRARGRAPASDGVARQLHGRRPGGAADHRLRRPRGRAAGFPHPLGGRHRLRDRRAAARRPRRGQPRLRPPRRAARHTRRAGRAGRLHPVRRREACSAGACAHPARRGA